MVVRKTERSGLNKKKAKHKGMTTGEEEGDVN